MTGVQCQRHYPWNYSFWFWEQNTWVAWYLNFPGAVRHPGLHVLRHLLLLHTSLAHRYSVFLKTCGACRPLAAANTALAMSYSYYNPATKWFITFLCDPAHSLLKPYLCLLGTTVLFWLIPCCCFSDTLKNPALFCPKPCCVNNTYIYLTWFHL